MKIKSHVKSHQEFVKDSIITGLTAFVAIYIFLARSQWSKLKLKDPLFYLADQLTYANLVSNAQAGNPFLGAHLGGPAGQQIGLSAYGVEWAQSYFVSFFADFHSGPWLAMNRFFIFTYGLTAVFAFIAFRWVRTPRLFAFVGALIFTFAGHHEGDGSYELFQTNLALIPLICALIIHLMDGKKISQVISFKNSYLSKYSKRLSVVIVTLIFLGELTSSNYYAVMASLILISFSIFFICRRSSWSKAKNFAIVFMLSLVPLVISYSPILVGRLVNGLSYREPATADRRAFASYANGGDLFSLILPNQSSGYWGSSFWVTVSNHIAVLKNFLNEYFTSPLTNNSEYNQHPIGVIGLGFIILLVAIYLGAYGRNHWLEKSNFKNHTFLNSLIFLGVTSLWFVRGGLGTFFSFLFPYVRAYSRFSIFIVFILLICIFSIVSDKHLFHAWIKLIIFVTLAAGLVDNISSTTTIGQDIGQSVVHSVSNNEAPWAISSQGGLQLRSLGILGTEKLVRVAEAKFAPGCTIVVLPLVEFPVDFNTGISSFYNYEELKPGLLPNHLKWTAAGIPGTKNNYLTDKFVSGYRVGRYEPLLDFVKSGPYCGVLMMRGLQDTFASASAPGHPTYQSPANITAALINQFGEPCYSDIESAVDLYCIRP